MARHFDTRFVAARIQHRTTTIATAAAEHTCFDLVVIFHFVIKTVNRTKFGAET